MQVMVIEPGLAYCDDLERCQELAHARGGPRGPGVRFVWMDAGGRRETRPSARQRCRAITPRHRFSDHDDVRDAGGCGPSENGVTVRIECRVAQMTVGVNQGGARHGGRGAACCAPASALAAGRVATRSREPSAWRRAKL